MVIVESLLAGWLIAPGCKRVATDFDQIWSREELHLGRITDQRIDQGTLVENTSSHPGSLELDGTREPDRSGPDHTNVQCVVGVTIVCLFLAHEIDFSTVGVSFYLDFFYQDFALDRLEDD